MINIICGAKTKTGEPCESTDLFPNGRCRLHGGPSSGPKTRAGRERAQKNLKQFCFSRVASNTQNNKIVEMEVSAMEEKPNRDKFRIDTEVIIITPDMAKAWLEKNTRNRSFNKVRVLAYAKEMLAGNWLDHHQGIAFYEDGTLADGQHRLAAVAASGVSVPMVVAYGLSIESGLMIDGHQRRKTDQSIKISGIAEWITKDIVATAHMMNAIEHNGRATFMGMVELVDYCEKHRDSLIFSSKMFPVHKKFITGSLVRSCVSCAYYYEDLRRLSEFCDVITNGMPGSIEDKAAVLARDFLFQTYGSHSGGSQRNEGVKRVMRAIQAFCERKALSKLYQPETYIYIPPACE